MGKTEEWPQRCHADTKLSKSWPVPKGLYSLRRGTPPSPNCTAVKSNTGERNKGSRLLQRSVLFCSQTLWSPFSLVGNLLQVDKRESIVNIGFWIKKGGWGSSNGKNDPIGTNHQWKTAGLNIFLEEKVDFEQQQVISHPCPQAMSGHL